jgi:transcription initiation factor TFIIIB Brf1 subunit/transcription initiation factor TFIIB
MIVSNKLKNNETIICENCAVVIASALSLDTRGARWEEFSREKENDRQRLVQQQFNNGDFLERVGAVRD